MTSARRPPPSDSDGPADANGFVGRDRELTQLVELLGGAGGEVPLVFLAGEAGIGKTRLARELEAEASARGHRVAWGLGWADAASPPYWPWTQVVRQLRGRRTGTDLGALVVADGDPADRAELFDAVAATIHRVTARQPLLVVLDDLHLADPPTFSLLGFVATHLRGTPLTIVATLRDREAARRPELAEPLRALDRLTTTIPLGGLDPRSVGELIGSQQRADEVHGATGGNPLYVREVARHGLERSDSLLAALRTRVAGLGEAVGACLAAVAVCGPTIRPDQLAAVLDVPTAEVADHLATARAAGVLEAGATRFTHPLLADAALAALPAAQLEVLHGAAVDHQAGSLGAADRAHHLLRAGPERWPEAVDACVQAAEEATASHAHEDATAHLERAVELARRHGAPPSQRAELALALAGSMVQRSGRADAEPHYRTAWALAQEVGDPSLIARAGARHSIQYYFSGDVTNAVAASARTALEVLGDGDTELHGRLHAVLSASTVATDPAGAIEHATRAVEVSRAAGDASALAAALVAEQVADLGPATLPRRLATAREIIVLAEAAREPDLAVHGRFLRMGALLERGAVDELDAQLRRQDALIDDFASPRFARHGLWFRCTRAMLDGDPDAVEALAGECLGIAEQLGDPDGILVFGAQYGVAQWMRGRVADMEGAYVEQMRADPEAVVWPAVLAWLWSTMGRVDEARAALDRVPSAAAIPSGQYTLLTMVTAADAAVALGDDRRARDLWEGLLPYSDRFVPIAMGAACWGSAASRLGALARHLGHLGEAVAHLERSISLCARLGARPWLAESQLALADVLLDTGGDAPRAERLVREASTTIDQLGLAVHADEAARLRAAVGSPVPHEPPPARRLAAVPTAPAGAGRPRISVLGTFEVVASDGTTPRWTSRKARQLLKLLVARRGVPATREQLMDQLWPGEDPARLGNRLSVALSTIRRSLDPARQAPPNRYVAVESGALRLVVQHLDLDTEQFADAATAAISAHRAGQEGARELLRAAQARYGGEALPDEPYSDWARPLRSALAGLLCDLLRHEIDAATLDRDHVGAAAACRSLLEVDPHDEAAHRGLVDALTELGAHGQADAARRRYRSAMAELGLPVA